MEADEGVEGVGPSSSRSLFVKLLRLCTNFHCSVLRMTVLRSRAEMLICLGEPTWMNVSMISVA